MVFTQDENLYLPDALARTCRALQGRIICIVAAPVMSTHGGAMRGAKRHLRLFGLVTSLRLAGRVFAAKLRGRLSRPRPAGPFHSLKTVARAFGIPFCRVERVNGRDFERLLDEYGADLLVSISCPQIIRRRVRERFKLGCINVHGAPLPRYRGLMPAFWALRHGESQTAVTVHDLEDKLDDGAILVQRSVTIEPDDTWDSLVRKTKAAGADALVEAVQQIERGVVRRQPNLEAEATCFSFPTARDGRAFRASGRRFL